MRLTNHVPVARERFREQSLGACVRRLADPLTAVMTSEVLVPHRNRRRRCAPIRFAPLAVAGVVSLLALPAVASAASTTPESLTDCSGSIAADANGAALGEPNLLDYSFSCDTDISAYTILVNRQAGAGGNLDDFNPSPTVLESDGVTPSSTESLTCEGSTPSDGVNCNAYVSSTAANVLSAGYIAQGSVDLVEPYCAFLPTGAAPGTPAVPQAFVQLLVTDSTGAQDGPFDLDLTAGCPYVPAFVPTPAKPKTKPVKPKGKGTSGGKGTTKGKGKGK